MQNSSKFSKTMPISMFLKSLGASRLDIVRNPKTSKRFFTVPGTDTTGYVAKSITKLSKEDVVSWMEGVDKDGQAFAMYAVHKQAQSNVEDSFSLED